MNWVTAAPARDTSTVRTRSTTGRTDVWTGAPPVRGSAARAGAAATEPSSSVAARAATRRATTSGSSGRHRPQHGRPRAGGEYHDGPHSVGASLAGAGGHRSGLPAAEPRSEAGARARDTLAGDIPAEEHHDQHRRRVEYLFTSESVTEGHPDKLCDQVSDAILDAIIRADPEARVACETATTTGLVMVLGEITTSRLRRLPARSSARPSATSATRSGEYGFDYLTCGTLDLDQGAVGGHRAGRRRGARGRAARPPPSRAGRRRPGDDVRVRLPRDAGADAAADRARAPHGPPARRGPQERPAAVPPPGRQDAGHGRVRARRRRSGCGRSSSPPSTTRTSATERLRRTTRRGGDPADDPGRAARRPTR